jgi:hypothetical protein
MAPRVAGRIGRKLTMPAHGNAVAQTLRSFRELPCYTVFSNSALHLS